MARQSLNLGSPILFAHANFNLLFCKRVKVACMSLNLNLSDVEVDSKRAVHMVFAMGWLRDNFRFGHLALIIFIAS